MKADKTKLTYINYAPPTKEEVVSQCYLEFEEQEYLPHHVFWYDNESECESFTNDCLDRLKIPACVVACWTEENEVVMEWFGSYYCWPWEYLRVKIWEDWTFEMEDYEWVADKIREIKTAYDVWLDKLYKLCENYIDWLEKK